VRIKEDYLKRSRAKKTKEAYLEKKAQEEM